VPHDQTRVTERLLPAWVRCCLRPRSLADEDARQLKPPEGCRPRGQCAASVLRTGLLDGRKARAEMRTANPPSPNRLAHRSATTLWRVLQTGMGGTLVVHCPRSCCRPHFSTWIHMFRPFVREVRVRANFNGMKQKLKAGIA
jgi:hypothetical protein